MIIQVSSDKPEIVSSASKASVVDALNDREEMVQSENADVVDALNSENQIDLLIVEEKEDKPV